MGKALKIIAGVAIIGLAIATGGIAIPGLMAISKGALIAIGATMALGGIMQALMAPKMPEAQLSRLNVRLDTRAARKMVFGTTAFPLDLRYHEGVGTDQEYIWYVICIAAHRVASVDEIWFEQDKAWDNGVVQSKFSGYLDNINIRLEGEIGNTVNVGTGWGSDDRLTGCAYITLRIKRTGNTKKSQSPLVNGMPSRVTIRGEGALLYDPRLDSTVPGGAGTHRADDQTTWGGYTDPNDTDNPALQLLTFLLGWKINGKLSVGCGVPPARIDLESFIAGANICDEAINLSGGGTQARYRTSGVASDADDRIDIINTFLACMNGTLRDSSGKLALTVLKNDLANYVLDLNDDDVISDFTWNQTKGLDGSYNVIRGQYVDPSNNALYQMTDYPEVEITSPDGIERVASFDLAFVEEGRRAQRLAKQILQRNQYRGTFSAVFKAKALGCNVGEVVRLSFEPLGWTNKLFRVIEQEIGLEGLVSLTLLEENAAIYAWDTEESAPVTAAVPVVYNPLNSPYILADVESIDTADGKNTIFFSASAPTANAVGDYWIDTDDGNKPYVWSGSTWDEVQDTGAAYARLGLLPTGEVAPDQVSTASVQDDAISGTTYVQRGSTLVLSGSMQTILDITLPLDAVGKPQKLTTVVDADDSGYEGSSTTINITVRLLTTGGSFVQNLIVDRSIGSWTDENITNGLSGTHNFVHTPTSTNRRYQIQIRHVDSTAATLQTSTFIQSEALKR